MSTSAAASSIAVAASVQVSAAHDAACRAEVRTYTHEGATVQGMRDYAACIERLYPEAARPETVLFFKALIVVALAGAAFGGRMGWRESEDAVETAGYAFFGALIFPGVALIIWLIAYCIKYLFTA